MCHLYSTQGGTNQWDVEVVTEAAEAISITEAVEVVDTQYRTSYNCYSSRTDRSRVRLRDQSSTVRYVRESIRGIKMILMVRQNQTPVTLKQL